MKIEQGYCQRTKQKFKNGNINFPQENAVAVTIVAIDEESISELGDQRKLPNTPPKIKGWKI